MIGLFIPLYYIKRKKYPFYCILFKKRLPSLFYWVFNNKNKKKEISNLKAVNMNKKLANEGLSY